MKYCGNCGSPLQDEDKVCQSCGTAVKQRTQMKKVLQNVQEHTSAGSNAARENVNQSAYNNGQNINIVGDKWDYTPISMWGYLGYEILFMIPLVGFILLLVFSFGGTQRINVRNFARSYFCLLIIVIILILVMGISIRSMIPWFFYYW